MKKRKVLIISLTSVIFILTLFFLGTNNFIKGSSAASVNTDGLLSLDYCQSKATFVNSCSTGVYKEWKFNGFKKYGCCPSEDYEINSAGLCEKESRDSSKYSELEKECNSIKGYGFVDYGAAGYASCIGELYESSCGSGNYEAGKESYNNYPICCPNNYFFDRDSNTCIKNNFSLYIDASGIFSGTFNSYCLFEGYNINTGVTKCEAGHYLVRPGLCEICPKDHYCPGGEFASKDSSGAYSSNLGINKCPNNGTSPAGSDNEIEDCDYQACFYYKTKDSYGKEYWIYNWISSKTYSGKSGYKKVDDYSTQTDCINANKKECYKCEMDGKVEYDWITGFNSNPTYCKKVSEYTTESSCKAAGNTTSEANACYDCGTSQTNRFVYGSDSKYGSNGQKCSLVSSSIDEDECLAKNNSSGDQTPKIGNTCGITNYGTWTESSCNAYPGYKEGKCYLWNSSDNCCEIKNYICSGTGSDNEPDNVPDNEPDDVPDNEPDNVPDNEPDNNVEENPPTGEIAIFVVLVIALAMLVYSIWYFKKVREN